MAGTWTCQVPTTYLLSPERLGSLLLGNEALRTKHKPTKRTVPRGSHAAEYMTVQKRFCFSSREKSVENTNRHNFQTGPGAATAPRAACSRDILIVSRPHVRFSVLTEQERSHQNIAAACIGPVETAPKEWSMEAMVFAVAFSLTCLRTILVIDSICSSGIVSRITRAVSSMGPMDAQRSQAASPIASPRQQAAAASANASRVRLVACVQKLVN